MAKSIEQLKAKLKSSAMITLVLGIISITWIIIDYFVIQTILEDGGLSKFSLEWILLFTSGLAFVAFHISVFLTLFYIFRVVIKIKPTQEQNEDVENKPDERKELNR